ncbi:MAG: 50S ribosomal protein L36 [SAR202 cluster bacterium]|nr:50S ribosomal protein L36 [SAR202 cluster bacterium]
MKVRASLKSWKGRDKNSQVIRRHGKIFIVNKKNPRLKARQG